MRILVGGLLALVSISSFAMPTVEKSDFDGTTTITSSLQNTDCDEEVVCPNFIYIWNSKYPNQVGIGVIISSTDYYSISGLSFNIDGKIVNHTSSKLNMPKFKLDGDTLINTTSQSFIIPLNELRKINKAKIVKVRVVTNHGFFEDTFQSQAKYKVSATSLELSDFLNMVDDIKE